MYRLMYPEHLLPTGSRFDKMQKFSLGPQKVGRNTANSLLANVAETASCLIVLTGNGSHLQGSLE